VNHGDVSYVVYLNAVNLEDCKLACRDINPPLSKNDNNNPCIAVEWKRDGDCIHVKPEKDVDSHSHTSIRCAEGNTYDMYFLNPICYENRKINIINRKLAYTYYELQMTILEEAKDCTGNTYASLKTPFTYVDGSSVTVSVNYQISMSLHNSIYIKCDNFLTLNILTSPPAKQTSWKTCLNACFTSVDCVGVAVESSESHYTNSWAAKCYLVKGSVHTAQCTGTKTYYYIPKITAGCTISNPVKVHCNPNKYKLMNQDDLYNPFVQPGLFYTKTQVGCEEACLSNLDCYGVHVHPHTDSQHPDWQLCKLVTKAINTDSGNCFFYPVTCGDESNIVTPKDVCSRFLRKCRALSGYKRGSCTADVYKYADCYQEHNQDKDNPECRTYDTDAKCNGDKKKSCKWDQKNSKCHGKGKPYIIHEICLLKSNQCWHDPHPDNVIHDLPAWKPPNNECIGLVFHEATGEYQYSYMAGCSIVKEKEKVTVKFYTTANCQGKADQIIPERKLQKFMYLSYSFSFSVYDGCGHDEYEPPTEPVVQCAGFNEVCECHGEVKYGYGDITIAAQYSRAFFVDGKFLCNWETFGQRSGQDGRVNSVHKCYCFQDKKRQAEAKMPRCNTVRCPYGFQYRMGSPDQVVIGKITDTKTCVPKSETATECDPIWTCCKELMTDFPNSSRLVLNMVLAGMIPLLFMILT